MSLFNLDEMVNPETGELDPEVKDRAMLLITDIGKRCQGESSSVVFFVLEAAMTEQINMFAPPLATMFEDHMALFKKRMALVLSIFEVVKQQSGEDVPTSGGTVEDVLGVIRTGFMQEPKPQE